MEPWLWLLEMKCGVWKILLFCTVSRRICSDFWKDGNRASEAAKVMKITANDLKELGVIEQVIEEPEPASIDNILDISEQMKEMILGFIEKYDKMTPEELVEQRYQRFRKF